MGNISWFTSMIILFQVHKSFVSRVLDYAVFAHIPPCFAYSHCQTEIVCLQKSASLDVNETVSDLQAD